MARAIDPIGIFDSGIGGMTVAKAIKELLPKENIVYFGDTAHLPYGDKSTAAIQAYSVKIADILIKEKCKVILIACNSASAAAYELVKEYVGSRTKVLNVIDPVINYARERYQNTTIGLIGTKQTVNSNVYKKKMDHLANNLELKSLATPLFVPMIEEGILDGNISQDIIRGYLTKQELSGIQSLILGCTHYPLIKNQIAEYYKGEVDILDSSVIVAEALKGYLEFHMLQNKQDGPKYRFLVSDYTRSFEELTRLFFGEKVELQKYPLWE
ncbi:MAG TPA: glutamate racemase [Cytophagales bacterium]|jgi:glutamate racemase|nr:glutamate racemase [Cytophagales bacterium]